MSNTILSNLNNPNELEKLYRMNTELFKQQFEIAFESYPESDVLKVWNERLNYNQSSNSIKTNNLRKDTIVMGVFASASGVITRLLFHFIDLDLIIPINLIFGILTLLLSYFIYLNRPSKIIRIGLITVLSVSIIFINLLPLGMSDTNILSYLHLPILLWIIVGIAYMGNEYKSNHARLSYLKFNGELIILYAIMAISGIILSGITMQLFSIIGLDIAEFYFTNIVLIGASSLLFVAIFLVIKNINLTKNIAPYIAKIFSPLVLITLIVYLITVLIIGKSPFMDRSFLLTFNIILILVLAITIFSITERQTQNKTILDWINFALIGLALVIDTIALSAIVFRLTSYGITPNRIVVLGVNILIFVNLIWIIVSYFSYLRNKKTIEVVQNAVTKYIPIYGVWAAIVTFIFPFIF
jgi:hypothetical protein